MTGTADPADVRSYGEIYLGRYVMARQVGDAAEMRAAWDDLVTENFDRIRAQVFIEGKGRLDPDEIDDAFSRALLLQTTRLVRNFRGRSFGEWWNATKTLVHYACKQEQAAAMAISRKESSLDTTWTGEAGEAFSPYDRYLAREDERRRAEQEDAEELEAEMDRGREFLDWAIPQLRPKLRDVAERDRAGIPVEQTMKDLDLKRDTVYKRRERYNDALDELEESYEES